MSAPRLGSSRSTRGSDLPPHDSARWEPEIAAFQRADRKNPPPRHATLFIGSSTIRLWTTLAEDFPQHRVINRGFGGSEIVFRSGGIAIAAGTSPAHVLTDLDEFVTTVRARLPETAIVIISLGASLAHWERARQNEEVGHLIEGYVADKPYLTYVDTYDLTLGPDRRPRAELLAPDGLHYNAARYRLLANRLRPHLPPPTATFASPNQGAA